MHPGRLFLLLTGLVETSLALSGCFGCSCQTPDRSAANPLRSPPAFSSAKSWGDVCDAACAPNKAYGPCLIKVSPTNGVGPQPNIECVTPEGLHVASQLAGDWQSVCSDRCGFDDWQVCTLDPARDTASCSRPGCTGGAGRRPEGFRPAPVVSGSEVGAHFARMAELEAVSVVAFRRLAGDLARLGAPEALVDRARAAQRDEARHAARIRALACRFGGRAIGTRVLSRRRPCTLRELAVENAREGCVSETFGVALALVQAKTATDPAVRREMNGIAADEARHAELAWDVARWADPQLDDGARAEVRRAWDGAIASLATNAATRSSPRSQTIAGLPSAGVARRLVVAFVGAMEVERFGVA